LRQLKQRIGLRLYIDPLTPSEVIQYVRVRWAKAGAQGSPPFSPDALTLIGQLSQGIPRLINSLCDSSLLMAFGDESLFVGLNYVRDAAANLGLIDSPPQSQGTPLVSTFSAAATLSTTEKLQASPKLVELPSQPNIFPNDPLDDPYAPKMAPYSPSKANSSFMKRLSEKFGLLH
jgi:hypothetical protein